MILIIGFMLAPLVFRSLFPDLYQTILRSYPIAKILHSYPIAGIFLLVVFDILWMWTALLLLLLSARFVRWIRSRD